MSKHRRPSSTHLATLPSRSARTSGAALVGTVLAVGLLPATAGAAFADTPSLSAECQTLLGKVDDAQAVLDKLPANATEAVKKAAEDKLKDAKAALAKACEKKDEPKKDGPWGGGKHRDDHDGGHWGRGHDRDDADDEDDEDDDADEKAADEKAEETDAAKDEKADDKAEKSDDQVAGVSTSDTSPAVVDVPTSSDVAGTSQVADVPVGSVDAGDGSTAGPLTEAHIGEALVGLGALGLAGVGAGTVHYRRRRSA